MHPRYKKDIHHAHNALDEVGMLADEQFHHCHREWNTLADELTHQARETGSSLVSYLFDHPSGDKEVKHG